MIKNVTRDEVIAAAKESTLAAVECCMKHWLFNANIQDIRDADMDGESCALCEKFFGGQNSTPRIVCLGCPLSDDKCICCQEFSEAQICRNNKHLNGFKEAAARLYTRLATIREISIKYPFPQKPVRIPIRIGNKYRNKLNNKVFLLASTGTFEVSLINIDTGERWRSNCYVGNVTDISDLEFYMISGQTLAGPKDFELVQKQED